MHQTNSTTCRKKPLKVVITSATLNGEKFSAYFDDCPVLTVPGRVFDVQLVHSKENHESDILTAAVETALQIHLHEPPGDILIFLTGQAEIDKVCILSILPALQTPLNPFVTYPVSASKSFTC